MDAAVKGSIERVSPLIRRLVAPNPGPFTYRGTCSYVVGAGEVAIIDPGPAEQRHIEALLSAVAGERLACILVTHTHRDHSPAARALKEATGAPIKGCAPYAPRAGLRVKGPGLDASHDAAYAPDQILEDGGRIALGGATIEALQTPGHTQNHLCFALLEEKALFTGDHVMGWSTTVVAPPDGSMTDYMASIERLRARDDSVYWPAHGEPVRDPARYLRALQHHRRAREAAILQRLEAGDATISAMVARIYESVDKRLHGAAAMTVLAHLEDLVARDLVVSDGPLSLTGTYALKRA
ncbi:MBL fold metallo-hydrolase [Methylocystis parvus]|uniref:MBL fold metallo-hydrolase n=1 Tax=Methylocystis parvus TaxID=134 RepID=A0A6B8M8G1_9HYPH|nr:MBL fold metallo-hydrolase [Methylocystis parvus]QGM99061.1 MBL fold metallo-hydrolase [Methylocystis parvus]WBK00571.1 MBL fold metallo-hydrolase [Methylocystis parvus OBBP]